MLGLKHFEADFRSFAKLPYSWVNISGMWTDSPSNFYLWLRYRDRFKKCKEIPDSVGYYVGGEPREYRENRKSPILRGLWQQRAHGYGPRDRQFLWAGLFANVYIKPSPPMSHSPLYGAQTGGISKITSRLHPQLTYCTIFQFTWKLSMHYLVKHKQHFTAFNW